MILFGKQKKETLPTPKAVGIPNVNTDVVPTVLSAYSLCYAEEQRLLQQQENGQPLINIRILGYMFIYNSGSSMLTELTRAVTFCYARGDAERLNDLGQFFLDYWIRPCECTLSYPDSIVFNFAPSPYQRSHALLISSKQTVVRGQSN